MASKFWQFKEEQWHRFGCNPAATIRICESIVKADAGCGALCNLLGLRRPLATRPAQLVPMTRLKSRHKQWAKLCLAEWNLSPLCCSNGISAQCATPCPKALAKLELCSSARPPGYTSTPLECYSSCTFVLRSPTVLSKTSCAFVVRCAFVYLQSNERQRRRLRRRRPMNFACNHQQPSSLFPLSLSLSLWSIPRPSFSSFAIDNNLK